MTALDLAHERLSCWALDHGWPTPRDVIHFARRCRVPAHDLGRLFGLFSVRRGARVVWVDAIRCPEHIGLGLPDELRAMAWRWAHAPRVCTHVL